MPTLNTRIKLKYDTLTNWTTANPTLLSGEVAVVAIPTSETNTVGQVTKPAIVFKVGDGTTAFNNLPYASALSADVYAWAKAANKPTYTATEVGAATLADITSAIQALDSTASISEGNFITGFDVVDGKVTNVTYGAPETVEIPTYTLTSTSEGNVTITGGETDSTVAINGFSTIAGLARSAVQTVANGTANGTILVDGEAVSVGGLGSAAYTESSSYANAAMGELANTAVQPEDLGSAAYNKSTDFATAAQGSLAASALQPGDITTGTTRGAISVGGTAVAVNGLGNAAYVNTDAFDAAGTAAGIGSAINGVVSAMNTRLNGAESDISALQSQVSDLGNALHFVGAGPLSGRPEDGTAGDVYIDTDNGVEYVYTGTAWEEFGNQGDHLTKAVADGYYAPINVLSSNVSVSANETISSVTANNGVITVSKRAISLPVGQVTGLGDLATQDSVTQAQVQNLSTTLAAINTNIGTSVNAAINGLDGAITNSAAASRTLTAFSQTNGVVTATFGNIAIAASQVTSGTLADARIPTLAISKINGLQTELDSKLESADLSGYVKGTNLTNNAIVLGNASSNIKASAFTISNGALTSSATTVVPTSNAVATYVTGRGYQTAAQVNSLVNAILDDHAGIDKVGTVTSVSAGDGLTITGTASVNPTVGFDTDAVFILDCGTSTTNV